MLYKNICARAGGRDTHMSGKMLRIAALWASRAGVEAIRHITTHRG